MKRSQRCPGRSCRFPVARFNEYRGALTAARVSSAPLADVLRLADTTAEGLSGAEASARLLRYGPNSVRTHRVSAIAVLGRQLRSAVLGLLAATAVLSFFLGDSKQAIIIGIILVASIGLGFVNEYRAERALRRAAFGGTSHRVGPPRRAVRQGRCQRPGARRRDPARVGEAVPADVRLIDVNGLECNESILSGESAASEKSPQPVNDAGISTSRSTTWRWRRSPAVTGPCCSIAAKRRDPMHCARWFPCRCARRTTST